MRRSDSIQKFPSRSHSIHSIPSHPIAPHRCHPYPFPPTPSWIPYKNSLPNPIPSNSCHLIPLRPAHTIHLPFLLAHPFYSDPTPSPIAQFAGLPNTLYLFWRIAEYTQSIYDGILRFSAEYTQAPNTLEHMPNTFD